MIFFCVLSFLRKMMFLCNSLIAEGEAYKKLRNPIKDACAKWKSSQPWRVEGQTVEGSGK